MTRPAKIEDLPRMLDIYNYYVEHTVLAFDLEPRGLEAGKRWFESHDERLPLIVDNAASISGWASLSEWAPHGSYRQTVELTIFVDQQCRGKGIGRRLFREMLNVAKKLDYHCIVSRITEGNEASRKMHEDAGFQHVGVMKEAGRKFEKWLDVHIYQKIIAESK